MRLRLRVARLSVFPTKTKEGKTVYYLSLDGTGPQFGATDVLSVRLDIEMSTPPDYMLDEWVEIDVTKPTVRS